MATELMTDAPVAMRVPQTTEPFIFRLELRELTSADFEVLFKTVISEHLRRTTNPTDGRGFWTGS